MSNREPAIKIPVDLANPGQFFACCGLLELADRLWPGAEGWFEQSTFCIRAGGTLRTMLTCLVLHRPEARPFLAGTIPVKPIVAPLVLKFSDEVTGQMELNFWAKIIIKSGTVQAVACPPWNMWSGNQKPLPIWLQLRDEMHILIAGDELTKTPACTNAQLLNLFRQTRPLTGRFGFDSSAAWNAQDVGFSPNDQNMSVESSPATELLAAVGFQRFMATVVDRSVNYYLWHTPASPAVAVAFACGGIVGTVTPYRFEIVNRGQYSAFGKARPITGESANV